jgi:hypothetical protein
MGALEEKGLAAKVPHLNGWFYCYLLIKSNYCYRFFVFFTVYSSYVMNKHS